MAKDTYPVDRGKPPEGNPKKQRREEQPSKGGYQDDSDD